NGTEFEAAAGGVVFVRDPTVERSALAAEPGTVLLALGGKPHAHDISEWEYSFAAYGYLAAGRAAEGIRVLHQGIVEVGESARLRYDLACLESRTGNRVQA